MRNRASRREATIYWRKSRQSLQETISKWPNQQNGIDEDGYDPALIGVREMVVNTQSRLRFVTLAGAVSLTAISSSAAAQPGVPDMSQLRPPPGQPMGDADAFGVLDANGDGVIDAAEWRQRNMMVYYILDRDRDLFLVRAEVPGLASSEFAAADSDHDDRLSGYEFNQAAFAQVEFADEDNSRTITLTEFQSYRERLAKR